MTQPAVLTLAGTMRVIGPGTDVSPGGQEARQWLAEELAKDDYADGRPLLSRVIDWVVDLITDWFSGFGGTSTPGGGPAPIVVALLVALLLGALALLLTRVRRDREALTDSDTVLGGLDLTPPEFRDRGRSALREGRWSDAVVEFTRAMAKEAADRTLLVDAPSLTAHEIGAQLAPIFPQHRAETTRTMDLFDLVRYGRHVASEADARAVAAHDDTLRKARPVLGSDR